MYNPLSRTRSSSNRIIPKGQYRNNQRRFKAWIREISVKSVTATRGGFCRYGRIYANRGFTSGPDRQLPSEFTRFSAQVFITHVNGNQNNNWRI